MLSNGRSYMEIAPWVVVVPGLAISLTVLGFNLFGDALRDALDDYIAASGERSSPRALATWPLCFTRGSSPLVKDRLSTDAERNVMGEAHWQDLAKVADYLRSRDVADGQLACWDDSSHALYTQLKISPSSRFVHAANWLVFFPSRREDIIREIRESDPRFVVTDVQMLGYSSFIAREEFQRDEPVFPKGTPKDLVNSFPWNEPIVFRAGRYLVHEVRPKDAELASNGPRQ